MFSRLLNPNLKSGPRNSGSSYVYWVLLTLIVHDCNLSNPMFWFVFLHSTITRCYPIYHAIVCDVFHHIFKHISVPRSALHLHHITSELCRHYHMSFLLSFHHHLILGQIVPQIVPQKCHHQARKLYIIVPKSEILYPHSQTHPNSIKLNMAPGNL